VPEGEYLALLSVKHSVDPDKLFQALVSAKERQRIICGTLSIECRWKSKSGRIFLMMDDSKVVAQVRISEDFLSEKTNPIGKFKDCERIRRYLAKKEATSFKLSEIGDLRAGMVGINLSAEVLEVNEPNIVNTRLGNRGVMANALIGDKTGRVQLSLWGEQVGSVSVGDTVLITNARMLVFRGKKQLQIGRKGTLKAEREHFLPA
jgi:ssDNA-binding replication factor A large subunit